MRGDTIRVIRRQRLPLPCRKHRTGYCWPGRVAGPARGNTKQLNEKIVATVKISPADLVVLLYEIAGENASFGSGLAQRAHIAAQS